MSMEGKRKVNEKERGGVNKEERKLLGIYAFGRCRWIKGR